MIKIIVAFLLAILVKTFVAPFNLQKAQQAFTDSFCGHCHSCSYNSEQINIPETGFFQINSILNNINNISQVTIKSGQITSTFHFPGKQIEMSMQFIVALPETPKIKGVILYNHPTVFGKLSVPTNLGGQITALIGLYTTQQFAVVIPNYLGYSLNQQFPHPYILYAQQNIEASMKVLNLVYSWFDIYGFQRKFLYVLGYSQGALFAVTFQFCLKDYSCEFQKTSLSSQYIFKGSIGMEGPYALKKVLEPFLFQDVGVSYRQNQFRIQSQLEANFAKPPLFTFTLLSFLYYSQYSGQLSQYLQGDFFKMICSKGLLQTLCTSIYKDSTINIKSALTSLHPSQQIALSIGFSALNKQMNLMTYTTSDLEKLPFNHKNSIHSLVSVADFKTQLDRALLKSSVVDKRAVVPTFIFSLFKDSVVPSSNSIYFAQNNPSVKLYLFENDRHLVCKEGISVNVDHEGGQILANIFALHYLNQNA